MRFLIDEDLPRSLTELFHQYGHEAVHVRDIGLQGASDTVIANYAKAHNYCLVTADLGFADIRSYPPQDYAGILVIRVPPTAGRSTILQLIEGLLHQGIVDDCQGNLMIVEMGRVRLRRGDMQHPESE